MRNYSTIQVEPWRTRITTVQEGYAALQNVIVEKKMVLRQIADCRQEITECFDDLIGASGPLFTINSFTTELSTYQDVALDELFKDSKTGDITYLLHDCGFVVKDVRDRGEEKAIKSALLLHQEFPGSWPTEEKAQEARALVLNLVEALALYNTLQQSLMTLTKDHEEIAAVTGEVSHTGDLIGSLVQFVTARGNRLGTVVAASRQRRVSNTMHLKLMPDSQRKAMYHHIPHYYSKWRANDYTSLMEPNALASPEATLTTYWYAALAYDDYDDEESEVIHIKRDVPRSTLRVILPPSMNLHYNAEFRVLLESVKAAREKVREEFKDVHTFQKANGVSLLARAGRNRQKTEDIRKTMAGEKSAPWYGPHIREVLSEMMTAEEYEEMTQRVIAKEIEPLTEEEERLIEDPPKQYYTNLDSIAKTQWTEANSPSWLSIFTYL